jgi:hypothetical protein
MLNWWNMVKNEWYAEVSTHVRYVRPSFYHNQCSTFSNVAERVEPHREHFVFVPVSYDSLKFVEEIRSN